MNTTQKINYPIRLSGPQLRVLHETLSMVLNDPTWPETTATSQRDWATLERACQTIRDGLTTARRAESHD